MCVARRSSIEPHSDTPRFGVIVAVAAPARSCCLSPMLASSEACRVVIVHREAHGWQPVGLRGVTDRRRHAPAACDIVPPFAGTAPDTEGGMTHELETTLECDRRVKPGAGRDCDLLSGLSEGQFRPGEPAGGAEGG